MKIQKVGCFSDFQGIFCVGRFASSRRRLRFFGQFVEAVAADRFVGVLGAQHHLLLVAGETVRMWARLPQRTQMACTLVTYPPWPSAPASGRRAFRCSPCRVPRRSPARRYWPAGGIRPRCCRRRTALRRSPPTSTSEVISRMFRGDSTGVERMAFASCDTTSSSSSARRCGV